MMANRPAAFNGIFHNSILKYFFVGVWFFLSRIWNAKPSGIFFRLDFRNGNLYRFNINVMKTYTLWIMWSDKCLKAPLLISTVRRPTHSHSYFIRAGWLFHRPTNKLPMDYSDGAFQLEQNFSKHLPNTMVINAKLSPIIFNKGFENINAFKLCPKISSEYAFSHV